MIVKAERGPTISTRFSSALNEVIFQSSSNSRRSDLRQIDGLQNLSGKSISLIRDYVIAKAAKRIVKNIGLSLFNDQYLENTFDVKEGTGTSVDSPPLTGTDQSARDLKSYATKTADSLVNKSFNDLPEFLTDTQIESFGLISRKSAKYVESLFLHDGSNQFNDYADTSQYYPTPWVANISTGPLVTRPLGNNGEPIGNKQIDFNFFTGDWSYFDFSPITALAAIGKDQLSVDSDGSLNIDVETLPKLKVNPAVKQGRTRLTQSWQPLGYMGVFPTIEDGGTQVPLTPHWGGVNAYSFESTSTGLELGSFNRPYLENGLLNDEFIRQSKFVAQLSTQLGSESKGSSNLRAQAEYWELGDSTTYPPGWWLSQANILAEQEKMSFKNRLNFLRDLSYAGSDSAIKTWYYKYLHDTIRPVTSINQLFFGSQVPDWKGNGVANVDDRQRWEPYQLRRNFTPPFPELPSGHAAFSTSAAVIFNYYFGTNSYNMKSEEFLSRFSPDSGFDGNLDNGNEPLSLEWKYFSSAAEEASFSRMLGGIHYEDGNILGQNLGTRMGHRVFLKSKYDRKNGNNNNSSSFNRYLSRNLPSFVFGDLSNNDFLRHDLEHISSSNKIEVYGYGGTDVISLPLSYISNKAESSQDQIQAGLFGGSDDDIFVIQESDIPIRWSIKDLDYRVRKDGFKLIQDDIIVVGNFDTITNNMIDDTIEISATPLSYGSITSVSLDDNSLFFIDGNFTNSNLLERIQFVESTDQIF